MDLNGHIISIFRLCASIDVEEYEDKRVYKEKNKLNRSQLRERKRSPC